MGLQATPEAPSVARGVGSYESVRVSVETGRGPLGPLRVASMAVVLLLVVVAGLSGSSATRYGLVLATAYAIVILGNNLLTATLGEMCLSPMFSLAIGAYTTAYALEHGHGLVMSALLSVVVAAVIGALLAGPTSRLRGLQTALVTFALAFAVPGLAVYLHPITGGDQGKYVLPHTTLGSYGFSGSDKGLLVLVVLLFAGCGLLHLLLLNSRFGRLAIAVGEAPQAAAALGVPGLAVRMLVWTWGAALGGLGGFAYALCVGYVSPTQFAPLVSVSLFVGGFIGGTRSVTGAWLGGLLIGALPMWLQNYVPTSTTTITYGAILLIALAVGGRGLARGAETVLSVGAKRWGLLR